MKRKSCTSSETGYPHVHLQGAIRRASRLDQYGARPVRRRNGIRPGPSPESQPPRHAMFIFGFKLAHNDAETPLMLAPATAT